MTTVRYPPAPFWPDDLAEREDAWEAPDALCVSAVEREARSPYWALWHVALALLGWLCVLAAGLMAVAAVDGVLG